MISAFRYQHCCISFCVHVFYSWIHVCKWRGIQFLWQRGPGEQRQEDPSNPTQETQQCFAQWVSHGMKEIARILYQGIVFKYIIIQELFMIYLWQNFGDSLVLIYCTYVRAMLLVFKRLEFIFLFFFYQPTLLKGAKNPIIHSLTCVHWTCRLY